jgi:hypothetical protein
MDTEEIRKEEKTNAILPIPKVLLNERLARSPLEQTTRCPVLLSNLSKKGRLASKKKRIRCRYSFG